MGTCNIADLHHCSLTVKNDRVAVPVKIAKLAEEVLVGLADTQMEA